MKLRVNPAIHIHFENDEGAGRKLVMDHLRHGTRFELLQPAALRALDLARDWIAIDDYLEALRNLGLPPDRASRFVDEAREYGLIHPSDAGASGDFSSLTDKLLAAKASQVYLDYQSEDSHTTEASLMAAYRAESTPPAVVKEYAPACPIPLGQSTDGLLGTLSDSGKPSFQQRFTAEWLSALLRHCFGVTGTIKDDVLGELLLKTHPSGGARHPVECYVACREIEGLSAGVYHYAPLSHLLEPIPSLPNPEELCEAAFPGLPSAPALLVFSVMPERVMWRYRETTSFLVMLLDLGHAVENFVLACECSRVPFSVNLNPDSQSLTQCLGLPALCELPLAAMAIGVGAKDSW